jgi:hypothetical protein
MAKEESGEGGLSWSSALPGSTDRFYFGFTVWEKKTRLGILPTG